MAGREVRLGAVQLAVGIQWTQNEVPGVRQAERQSQVSEWKLQRMREREGRERIVDGGKTREERAERIKLHGFYSFSLRSQPTSDNIKMKTFIPTGMQICSTTAP